MRLLAEAFDIAAAESDRGNRAIPAGVSGELAYRSVRAEVATVLHETEHSAERRLAHARALTTDYPDVFRAFGEGAISERHTSVIIDAGLVIGGDISPNTLTRRARYEQAALRIALVETPNRLRAVARSLAEQQAELAIDERHTEARRQRCVRLRDAGDGMAELMALLPAVQAHGVYDRLTEMARRLEREQCSGAIDDGHMQEQDVRGEHVLPGKQIGDVRPSRDEVRAVLFARLLLDASPNRSGCSGSGGSGLDGSGLDDTAIACTAMACTGPDSDLGAIRARIQVSVSAETLLAANATTRPSDPLAQLIGYGTIDSATSKTLAAAADSWELVRHDSATGAVLSVDRYRPSEQILRYLTIRDEGCRFIGCGAPASRCDVDHTIDAAHGGETRTDNLAQLCRSHHTLKHHGG